ncbi:MAG: glutamate--tRNA ligase family protein [Phycisphaerales bacterium]
MGDDDRGGVTRLAPSPTGALHLGNARTFLVNWALARRLGWTIVLRIEDLDGPRVKPGADRGAMEILAWLGIDWDVGPIWQSAEMSAYASAMERLCGGGLAYPCALTRREIEAAASAPHGSGSGDDGGAAGHESRFPPELRPEVVRRSFDGGVDEHGEPTNWRFVCPPDRVEVRDRFAGSEEFCPWETVGDFVLWTKRGEPSYQLAVTVDDDRQRVNKVVRGDDLLDSAARQMLLRRALGMEERVAYWHLPLVVGTDGRRLAKRHGDTRISHYRERGVPPERIVGLVANWCGIGDAGCPEAMDAAEFADRLCVDTMPRSAITLTPSDEAWLSEGER